MAHVEVYDEDYNYIQSKRDSYRKVEDVRGIEDKGDRYYPDRRAVDITLYLDEANGLVVHDVAQYEKWLGYLTFKPVY